MRKYGNEKMGKRNQRISKFGNEKMRKKNQRISKFENEKMGDVGAQVIGNNIPSCPGYLQRGNVATEKEKKAENNC